MYRTSRTIPAFQQSLINQPVTIPPAFLIGRLWQCDSLANESSERIRLRQCLSVQLINPLRWSICRDHNQRDMLIIRLCNRRCQIQQGGSTGNADRHRRFQGLRHSQGIESCAALIRHRIAGDIWTRIEIVYDRGIPTARTNHSLCDPMSHEQGREYIDIFFIAIHINIIRCASSPAWPQSRATPAAGHSLSEVRRRHRDDSCYHRYSYSAARHTDASRQKPPQPTKVP